MNLPHFFRSLTVRLGIAVTVIELVILIVVGVFYYNNFSDQIDQRQQEKLLVASNMIANGGLNLTTLIDYVKMSQLLGENVADAMVIDEQNTVIFSLAPAYRRVSSDKIPFLSQDKIKLLQSQHAQDPSAIIYDTLTIGDQQFLGSYYAFNIVPHNYSLFFRADTTAAQHEKSNTALLLILGFLATAGATSIVIFAFFNRFVLLRIENVVKVMRRVEHGDLSIRVPTRSQSDKSGDELDRLGDSFNKMLEARVNAENALYRSEVQLRTIISNLPLLTWVTDMDGKFTFWDGRLAKDFGVPQASILGTNAFDHYERNLSALDKPVQEQFTNAHRRALAGEVSSWPAVLVGGQYLENSYFPLYNTAGKQEWVLGVSFDVTSRTLAELDRQKLLNTLEQRVQERTRDLIVSAEISRQITTVLSQRELLSTLANLTRESFKLYQVSVFSLDPQTQILKLVAASGQAGQTMLEEHKQFHIDDIPGVVPLAARTKQTTVINDTVSHPEHRPNPLLPETQSEMAIPFIMGGDVLGVLDVQSEQKGHFTENEIRVFGSLANQIAVAVRNARLFEEVFDARERAENADKVKSAFLASMSHELRTPLNAIINFSKFLAKGIPGPLNEEQRKFVIIIADSGQHLLNLINDVLDMSKIEAGALKLFIENDINLGEVLKIAIGYIAPTLAGKPVELIQEIPETLPVMTGDRKRLLQVLLNIMSNAAKFTEQGYIKVKASYELDRIVVSVEDTGPGIAPEDYQGVFTPFKQTDSGLRQGGGTGLGMPISIKLVEAHNGRMWFESKLVQGTTFFIKLPILPVRFEEAHARIAHHG